MAIKNSPKTIIFLENGNIVKNDILIITILFLLGLSVLYFDPMLLALLVGKEPFVAKISVVIFVLVLNMMWLYGAYHCVHILFSYFRHSKLSYQDENSKKSLPVAILYMTRNDFNEKACLSAVNQKYKNFNVYICDDSDNEEFKTRTENFIRDNGSNVTLLRRKKRRGYKAGNINDALKLIDKRFDFILINDADTLLPDDFLRIAMPKFKLSPKIAFVQGMQKSLNSQRGYLGKVMKAMIDIHWQHYMSLKNRFGFVMWYGHGAVLRRSVIEETGGMPEVVTEDLAFSSEIRRRGYFGIVADDLSCQEEFPETIEKFRKRNRKWVRGTYQYLTKFYPRLLKAKNVPWFEKADIFISAFALLQAIPFLLLICVASFIMPFYYNVSQVRGPLFLVPPLFYDNWAQLILKTRYNVFWMLDFYLIMFVVIFFPLLPAMVDMWREKRKMLNYIYMSCFLHLSILLDSAKEIILYVITGQTYFPVTNNKSDTEENRCWILAEFILGLILMYFAFATYNLWLVSLGFAFMLTFLFLRIKSKRFTKFFIPVPFLVTVMIMFFIGVTIIKNF